MELARPSEEISLFYIFPSNGHYVAVNSGAPWWATSGSTGFPFLPAAYAPVGNFKDFVVLKGPGKTLVTEGNFDAQWKLSDEQKKILRENGVNVK